MTSPLVWRLFLEVTPELAADLGAASKALRTLASVHRGWRQPLEARETIALADRLERRVRKMKKGLDNGRLVQRSRGGARPADRLGDDIP